MRRLHPKIDAVKVFPGELAFSDELEILSRSFHRSDCRNLEMMPSLSVEEESIGSNVADQTIPNASSSFDVSPQRLARTPMRDDRIYRPSVVGDMAGMGFDANDERRFREISECFKNLEVSSVYVDANEIEAVFNSSPVSNSGKAVFLSVNERAHVETIWIGFPQILESLRISFNHHAAPAFEHEGASVGKMYSVPCAELTAQAFVDAENVEDSQNDSLLPRLAETFIAEVDELGSEHFRLLRARLNRPTGNGLVCSGVRAGMRAGQ